MDAHKMLLDIVIEGAFLITYPDMILDDYVVLL